MTYLRRHPLSPNGVRKVLPGFHGPKSGLALALSQKLFYEDAAGGNTGTIAWTEADDTIAITGSVGSSGTIAFTEANDTAALTGSVGSSGTISWTEADDVVAMTGTAAGGPVSGTIAWTEASDGWSVIGNAQVNGSAAWTDANDSWLITGGSPVSGVAAWTDDGDIFSISGSSSAPIGAIPGGDMTSMVAICSNALLMLGADPINSLDASEGDRAILCLNLFPSARNAVVREYLWDSCTKRAILAPLSTAPEFDWGYKFQIPSDLHRLWSVGYKGCSPIDHKVEGREILCDEAILPIVYIFKNGAVETWDASLVHVMEAYMAKLLAYPITKDRGLIADMATEYEKRLRRARAADGQQGTPDFINDSPLISARGRRLS